MKLYKNFFLTIINVIYSYKTLFMLFSFRWVYVHLCQTDLLKVTWNKNTAIFILENEQTTVILNRLKPDHFLSGCSFRKSEIASQPNILGIVTVLRKFLLQDFQFSSVRSLSHVWLFATPWTAAWQAPLSITSSQSLLKLRSIESVTLSNK